MLKNNFFKLTLLFIILSISTLILAACGQGGFSLQIVNEPIEFSVNDLSQEVKLEISTEGFGEVKVDTIQALIWNPDTEEEIFNHIKDINEEIDFVVPGVTQSYSYNLNLKDIYPELEEFTQEEKEIFYEENLEGKTFNLEIILEGSRTEKATANINFLEIN